MTKIIDKRFLPKNQSAGSRQKFLDRYKTAIKKKIKGMVSSQSIKDFGKKPQKVKIQADDLDIPHFNLDQDTGNKDRIYVGNKQFHKGQKLRRPQGGTQQSGAGTGEGSDEFEFVLTEKEFTDLFFEDLALPDLLKKEFTGTNTEIQHAGYSSYGGPSSLNVKRTMLNAYGRKVALKSRNQCDGCVAEIPLIDGKHRFPPPSGLMACEKNKYIQFLEDCDLKFNFKERVDVPTTKAVMFCLMDVSGSMGENEKDMAKRFYILLNLFLKRNYTIVDVVFVRHTQDAEEVDEDTFFYDRDTGGTLVSSGYEKVNEIITKRYNPENWNIYIAQASDGDNETSDNEHMVELLTKQLLPATQYFAYINVGNDGEDRWGGSIYPIIRKLMKDHSNLQAKIVLDYSDIFPVFRSLFKRKDK